MIDYNKTVLKNGVRVITAPLKQTNAVTLLFLVNAGSRYETKQNNGVFHFLEHMVFKGTKKRPTSLDISKELDSVGANFNAFTSDEYTGFYISSTASYFPKALDLLSDIIYNSSFPSTEIKKEKGVILEEINMYRDLPQKQIQDLVKRQLFGNTPLGRSTLGTVESVSGLTRKDLVDINQRYYSPENTVAIVAGAPGDYDWTAKISQKLGKIKQQENIIASKNKVIQTEPQIAANYKKTDQAHLVVSFRSFSRFDQRRYALRVLNNILGETMSSRLFTEIREKRGLAYYVGSDISEFSDTGAQGAFAGLDVKRCTEALKVILAQYSKLATKKVSSEELTRAKDNIKGKLYLSLEDSFSITDFLGEQELLFDSIKQPEQILDSISAVSATDIMKVAKELFVPENLNISVIGPYKNTTEFAKVVKNW